LPGICGDRERQVLILLQEPPRHVRCVRGWTPPSSVPPTSSAGSSPPR